MHERIHFIWSSLVRMCKVVWREKELVEIEDRKLLYLEERFQAHDGDCIGGEEDKSNRTDNLLETSARFDEVFVVTEGWKRDIVLRFLVFELEMMVS